MLARKNALKIGIILASALCFAQAVVALDLGELVLESSLSEPLDATIELQDVAGLDPSQIAVSLGTADDFAAVGIELSEAASRVQFAVEMDGAEASIHLMTPNPVSEPFLDLLLIVTWPDGMVQRDYTILMNLAGSTTTAVGSLVIPGTTNSPSAADAGSSQEDYGTGVGDDGQTYSVANGDSMWEIAVRTRSSADVSVHQMMVAIQRANEDAFINNNINRVLSGKVLRIPTPEEIALVDQEAAIAQINQQNQQLSSQPLAVNNSTGSTGPVPEQDQLTVLTDDQAATVTGGNSDLQATIATLESEMMLSEESLDRARLENAELTSRFAMLEEEMDLLQNLITAEDTRLAQLQADLAAQAEITEEALATTETATGVMAAQQSQTQPGIAGNVEGWLQNTAVLMGVIVGLLLLVLGYLFWQRRRMDAAVYAFDSGIPELETAENSTFAPVAKSGWFSGSGNKPANADIDAGGRPAEPGSLTARNNAAQGEASLNKTTQDTTYYVDEEQAIDTSDRALQLKNTVGENVSGQAFPNEANTAFGTNIRPSQPEHADEAEFADALIAEAKVTTRYPDDRMESLQAGGDSEMAEKEARELAELVAPDVKMTESTVPESFEFTLKTAPEALSEGADLEPEDDVESFDFQLSGPAAADKEQLLNSFDDAETQAAEEEADINSLLLDEDETDFQAAAPMNECDTKLDLAVAYEAMGDVEGAIEILDEVVADGDKIQVAEATPVERIVEKFLIPRDEIDLVQHPGKSQRIALCVEYDGSAFNGWQTQLNPALVTVQETLEQALTKIADQPVKVHCAGRTDTGVHATGQIVHFDTTSHRSTPAWVKGTNSRLPKHVSVRWAQEVADEFHARFSAQSRRYRYTIANMPVRPALVADFVTPWFYPLDEQSMHAAAQQLLGENDFTSYRATACQSRTPMRNLMELSVTRQGEYVIVEVEANAFLLHMVRNLVGVLLAIGDGRRPSSWAREVLELRDRCGAGVTAPPTGLCLVKVRYPEYFKLLTTPLPMDISLLRQA